MGEVFYWCFGVGIGGVVWGIGVKQGGYQGVDFVVVVDVFVGFVQEEECRFGIDCVYFVVFGFVDFGDGFFQYFVDGVDGDVWFVYCGDGVGEQFFYGCGVGEIVLQCYCFGFGCLQCGDGGVGIGFVCGVVVVDGDCFCVVGGEIMGDQFVQVFGVVGDEDGFVFDGVVDYGVFFLW